MSLFCEFFVSVMSEILFCQLLVSVYLYVRSSLTAVGFFFF